MKKDRLLMNTLSVILNMFVFGVCLMGFWSFAWMTCDLYASIVMVLSIITARLQSINDELDKLNDKNNV